MIATPPALTEQAKQLDGLWMVFAVIAFGVGALVLGLMLFVMVRGRGRQGLPIQKRENIPIEVTYVAIPLLVVGGLFAATIGSLRMMDRADAAPSQLTIQVVGFQWQWQFTYPAEGIVVTGGPGDEYPELVLPAGRTVRFELTSRDVVHSFWVPGFRFKRDVFPGETSSFQVDVADERGEWSGVCAEFCGLDHATMRFAVRIVSPAEFTSWIAEHQR